jgi:hypothetical protein
LRAITEHAEAPGPSATHEAPAPHSASPLPHGHVEHMDMGGGEISDGDALISVRQLHNICDTVLTAAEIDSRDDDLAIGDLPLP